MRITITDSAGATTLLADHGREGPSGMSLERQFAEQIQEFLRGAAARPVDRGNALIQLSFEVRREHASITAAQVYWFDRLTTVPRSGNVVLQFDDQTTQRSMPNSTVGYTMAPPLGQLTTEQITIKSGQAYVAVPVRDSEGNLVFDSDNNPVYGLETIV